MKTVSHFGIEVEDVSDFVENLPNIYSQAHQDLFALGINNYVNNGTFVDIACAMPRDCNNTFLLEQFGWKGISLDIKDYGHLWEQTRTNKFLHCDALQINYEKLFNETFLTKEINYLSLDADDITNKVLELLPFSTYEFKVITIEHDLYANGDFSKKQFQENFLTQKGYKKIANNICVFEKYCVAPFEDWWVSASTYVKYQEIFDMCKEDYVYSDEFLNKCSLLINRDNLLKNKEKIHSKQLISTEEIFKCLSTQTLDENNKEIKLLNRPKTIFVPLKWVDKFVEKVLPFISYDFTLFTYGEEDIVIQHIEQLVNKPNLQYIYSNKQIHSHNKVQTTLPKNKFLI